MLSNPKVTNSHTHKNNNKKPKKNKKIYNEEVNDLLAPENRKLPIHESAEHGVYVAGLRETIVTSPEQVLALLETGEANRHVGATRMNEGSSRSHTVFRMVHAAGGMVMVMPTLRRPWA